ncbi:MAG: diguanylate cyclase [Sulfurimonas sp.]|uniref:diguanylate cyclase n=1 Tax=Sulfurimonas sp. TaxID=2022749 RepID=UPI00261DD399|nr:diguanylate cyclase [Sulfurimonas sp.]MCW8895084.1 diguanylate cyclase [Sulfurimonas sp.]MCW8954345.1 diguanylate cyclase [Sulfurimonas sp.]MCW9066962.1 diguanylate cyclase [Sulfurimonas sp.]
MKHSIKKIFSNLSIFLIFLALFSASEAFLTSQQSTSYDKIDNLKNQKAILSSLIHLSRDDIELALIQFNGKSTQLHTDIEKLKNSYKYNFTEQFIVSNEKEYLSDLEKLDSLTTLFNDKAHEYYSKDEKNNDIKKQELDKIFYSINNQIDSIMIKSLYYDQSKFKFQKIVSYISFIVILLGVIWYRKRLSVIYADIKYLYNVDQKNFTIFSEEVDSIALRMRRKPTTSDNPSMLDPITGLNNLKGMMNSYSEKKGMKEGNFTSVTVIEIDNFSKTNRIYSQEFTQSILKKVAFTISLHEQATDVIARTDYNQFTLIFSRPSKEQSFKDVDIIRQSISELKLKSAQTGPVTVTISGGFVIKPNNVSLEEASREAKKVLAYSKAKWTNKITQIRDIAEDEL